MKQVFAITVILLCNAPYTLHAMNNEELQERLDAQLIEVFSSKNQTINVAAIEDLIAQGASPDAYAAGGFNVLTKAVQRRHALAVQQLLQRGAKPNNNNHDDSSPLCWSVLRDSFDLFRLLVGYKADVAYTKGRLPARRALIETWENRIKKIRQNEIEELNEHLMNALDRDASIDSLQKILAKGASANASTPNNFTALTKAIATQNTDAVRLLLEHKANVNEPNGVPLTWAIILKNKTIFDLLMDHGADIELALKNADIRCSLADLEQYLALYTQSRAPVAATTIESEQTSLPSLLPSAQAAAAAVETEQAPPSLLSRAPVEVTTPEPAKSVPVSMLSFIAYFLAHFVVS